MNELIFDVASDRSLQKRAFLNSAESNFFSHSDSNNQRVLAAQ